MFGWITSRRLSLFIVVAYLAVFSLALLEGSPGEVLPRLLPVAAFFILPLACIWYGDELGEYVGALPGPAINKGTPGWLVKTGGWLLLALPAFVALFLS